MSNDDLETRLRESLGVVLGQDLVAHLRRDGVLLVAPGIDLVTCGLAISRDDAALVGAWLERGQLRKPTSDEYARWTASPERRWRAAVVQPYVLIQSLD